MKWRNLPKDRGSPYWWKDEGESYWFSHVHRKATDAPVRKSEFIQVEETKKGRGRPKIILVEVIKNDMSINGVIKSMNLDKAE